MFEAKSARAAGLQDSLLPARSRKSSRRLPLGSGSPLHIPLRLQPELNPLLDEGLPLPTQTQEQLCVARREPIAPDLRLILCRHGLRLVCCLAFRLGFT
jgi:hypothetical protein